MAGGDDRRFAPVGGAGSHPVKFRKVAGILEPPFQPGGEFSSESRPGGAGAAGEDDNHLTG